MNETYDINTNNGYLLLRATQQYRIEIAKALQSYDVTPTQFFILMSIWYQGRHVAPPTQAQVAHYAAVDINVTSQVVRKLITRGLVERSVKPGDSRAYVLLLTPEGESLAATTGGLAEKFHQSFFSGADQRTLQTELLKLIGQDEK